LGKYGVAEPEARLVGAKASLEACSSRFVVPRAFVWDERAEQTSATFEFGIYDLVISHYTRGVNRIHILDNVTYTVEGFPDRCATIFLNDPRYVIRAGIADQILSI
jgi:hypothetical protein